MHPEYSRHPIRYADGEIRLVANDLAAHGLGATWGHRRTYSNRLGGAHDYGNGCNWLVEQWRHLVDVEGDGSVVAVMVSTEDAVWFDKVGAAYQPRYGAKDVLKIDSADSALRLCRADGSEYAFHDFTQTEAGKLKQFQSPGGQILETDYDVEGRLSESTRSVTIDSVETEESFVYEYIDDALDPNDGLLASVVCRRQVGGGGWVNIERCRYTYHSGATAHGNAGDLERAMREAWDGSSWVEQGVHYYRYYKDSSGAGYQHGLKLVLGPQAFAEATSPLTATDAALKEVADYYFEYDGSHRVAHEENGAGRPTTDFSYAASAHSAGYDHWKTKTVETIYDENQNVLSQSVVYTNFLGQVLVKDFQAGGDSWIEAFQYDSAGRLQEHALPSAVVSYNDADANLAVSYQSSSGVVYVKEYASSTTATVGTAGDAAGYLKSEKIRQGSAGAPVTLREVKYKKNTTDFDIFVLAEETVYRSDASGGSESATTRYDDEFFTGTHRVEQRTTTMPAVATAENGENVVHEAVDVFDLLGNLRWNQGARGFLRRMTYDAATGGMTQRIDDVDVLQTSDEPSGWTTIAGGGLHLTTDYQLDAAGRVTQLLGPVHPVDLGGASPQDLRTAEWTVYSPDGLEVRRSRGYRLGSGTSGALTLVNPVRISVLDREGRVLEQVEAERTATSTLVTATEAFARSTYRRWTTHAYDDAGRLIRTRVYHTIPTSGEGAAGTHFAETTLGYDVLGRQVRRVSPGGTIRRAVFDARGRLTSEWVGTDDAPTSGDWSPTNAAGTNLVKTSDYVYDGGSDGGDGNLTQHTAHVDGSHARVTSYSYDWRNRLEQVTRPADEAGRVTYAKTTYDNLNRATTVETYEDPAAGSDVLLSRQQTLYDARGRVYRTVRYAVSAAGVPGDKLTDNFWYDCCGNLIKEQPAGSKLFAKRVYDGLARNTDVYIGFDVDESGYAAAATLTGDTILQEERTEFDHAGNVAKTALLERYHDDASSTGSLTAGTNARPSYTAHYPDGIGRLAATAEYGNQGNDATAFVPAETAPARSDTVLVSERVYDAAGQLWKTIDPNEREDRREYDAAGRLVRDVRNYKNGDPTSGGNDEDVTVERTYTADGLLATLTAKQKSAANDQTTVYVYGTDAGGLTPAVYRTDWLRAEIYPDSDDPSNLSGNGTDGVYDRVEYKYNRLGEVIEKKDQNGTVHVYEYDDLGRQVRDVATPGTGVDDAVVRLETGYHVRGLVATLTSFDHPSDNGSAHVVNQIVREYDDLNLLVREYQEHAGVKDGSTPSVQYAYDDTVDGNGELVKGMRLVSTTYPDGRKVHATYGASGGIDDAANRLAALKEDNGSGGPGSVTLASYAYLGQGHPVAVNYPVPDVRLDLDAGALHAYAGLDRFGRVVDQRWTGSASSSSSSGAGAYDMDRYKYGYDRAGNRLWRENVVAGAQLAPVHLDELYGYDQLYRLSSLDRGNLTGTPPTGIAGTPTAEENWALDPLGNWDSYVQKSSGSTTLNQFRFHNKANELTQLTKLFYGVDWQDPTFDRNGNMLSGPQPGNEGQQHKYVYDAWNRLVQATDASDVALQEHQYDPRHRRTVRIDRAASPDVTAHYYYSDQWQVLEERVGADGSSARTDAAYVYHPYYVDAVAVRYWDANDSGGPDTKHYYLQDANFNVTALVTAGGSVVERYAYAPYGACTVLEPDFTPDADNQSDVDNELLFTGRRIDPVAGLQLNRHRFYHQQLGRWVSRDPIGYEGSEWNLYEYAGNSPSVLGDPSGLIPGLVPPPGWGNSWTPTPVKKAECRPKFPPDIFPGNPDPLDFRRVGTPKPLPCGTNVNVWGAGEAPGFDDYAASGPDFDRENHGRPPTSGIEDHTVDQIVCRSSPVIPETLDEMCRICKSGCTITITNNCGRVLNKIYQLAKQKAADWGCEGFGITPPWQVPNTGGRFCTFSMQLTNCRCKTKR